MKKFVLIVAILAVLAAAFAWYLKATTPKSSTGVRLPLTESQRELLASVPASAEGFALIPTAAVVRAKLIANPITREPLLHWAEDQQLPRSWMIGGADLVVWRAGKQTSYAVHLDPLRAALVRMYLMLGSGIDARVQAGTFLINAGAGAPLGIQRVDEIVSVASGLGPADALIVQQRAAGAFPPIGRPAVTLIHVGARDIDLVSVAARTTNAGSEGAAASTQHARFPAGAVVSAAFQQPPRIVSDLDRLFVARVSKLLDDGGSIVLYDVNAGTLLPRPDGLIIANATPENVQTVDRISDAVKSFGDVKQSGDQILVSLDRDSLARYGSETFVAPQLPSNDWSARIDAKRAVPLLERLGDNTGLRIAAPRIFRAARDLRRWIEYLTAADWVEASHSVNGSREELRVRIASK